MTTYGQAGHGPTPAGEWQGRAGTAGALEDRADAAGRHYARARGFLVANR
jgi:hypothetical protein